MVIKNESNETFKFLGSSFNIMANDGSILWNFILTDDGELIIGADLPCKHNEEYLEADTNIRIKTEHIIVIGRTPMKEICLRCKDATEVEQLKAGLLHAFGERNGNLDIESETDELGHFVTIHFNPKQITQDELTGFWHGMNYFTNKHA
jgi:hypothetical protein